MAFDQLVKALHQSFLTGGGSVASHSYDTLPDNDDITVTAHATADTYGDWAEVASTVGSAAVWVCGVYVANASATLDGKIDLGTGASSSEAAFAVVPYFAGTFLTTEAGLVGTYYSFPFPVHVPNGTRVASRMKTGTSAADTILVVSEHATGLPA